MKIKPFIKTHAQMSRLGCHSWSVARLFELSKDFKVMEIPLDHLHLHYTYENLTLRDMVMHMIAVVRADLSFPIILDEDGEVMDGRHRIMKALIWGHKTIKAVRFDENPEPCRIKEDD
jgi:hypothetical protein